MYKSICSYLQPLLSIYYSLDKTQLHRTRSQNKERLSSHSASEVAKIKSPLTEQNSKLLEEVKSPDDQQILISAASPKKNSEKAVNLEMIDIQPNIDVEAEESSVPKTDRNSDLQEFARASISQLWNRLSLDQKY